MWGVTLQGRVLTPMTGGSGQWIPLQACTALLGFQQTAAGRANYAWGGQVIMSVSPSLLDLVGLLCAVGADLQD